MGFRSALRRLLHKSPAKDGRGSDTASLGGGPPVLGNVGGILDGSAGDNSGEAGGGWGELGIGLEEERQTEMSRETAGRVVGGDGGDGEAVGVVGVGAGAGSIPTAAGAASTSLPQPQQAATANTTTTAAAINNPDHHDDWSQSLRGDFSEIVKSHAEDDESTIRQSATAAGAGAAASTKHAANAGHAASQSLSAPAKKPAGSPDLGPLSDGAGNADKGVRNEDVVTEGANAGRATIRTVPAEETPAASPPKAEEKDLVPAQTGAASSEVPSTARHSSGASPKTVQAAAASTAADAPEAVSTSPTATAPATSLADTLTIPQTPESTALPTPDPIASKEAASEAARNAAPPEPSPAAANAAKTASRKALPAVATTAASAAAIAAAAAATKSAASGSPTSARPPSSPKDVSSTTDAGSSPTRVSFVNRDGGANGHSFTSKRESVSYVADSTTATSTVANGHESVAPAPAEFLARANQDPDMAPTKPLTEQLRDSQKAPALATPLHQGALQIPENKENVPPEDLADSLAAAKLDDTPKKAKTDGLDGASTDQPEEQSEIDYAYLNDPVIAAERAQHLRFINEALDMARLALRINETPVGCVLVHDGKVIARGMNATNVTRNGTRHAEYMALAALFSYPKKEGPRSFRLKPKALTDREEEEKAARLAANEEARLAANEDKLAATEEEAARAASDQDSLETEVPEMPDTLSETLSTELSPHEGNEDGKKGHLHPYGQKILPIDRVDRSIVAESILYVTVEPCIMCASLLRQLRIKKVYFGAVNDKFGGTGGVFSVHANSLPVREDGQTAAAHPIAKPIQLPDGTGGSLGVSFPPGGGDGGNVEPGYEIEGGWGRDEAVALLRRFYVQENGRAPVPRKKEGRAARLAAMMEQDGVEGDQDGETVTPGDDEANDANGAADEHVESSASSYHEAQTQLNGVN